MILLFRAPTASLSTHLHSSYQLSRLFYCTNGSSLRLLHVEQGTARSCSQTPRPKPPHHHMTVQHREFPPVAERTGASRSFLSREETTAIPLCLKRLPQRFRRPSFVTFLARPKYHGRRQHVTVTAFSPRSLPKFNKTCLVERKV